LLRYIFVKLYTVLLITFCICIINIDINWNHIQEDNDNLITLLYTVYIYKLPLQLWVLHLLKEWSEISIYKNMFNKQIGI